MPDGQERVAAWRRRTKWPRWAGVLVDDGWTDSLFERVVASLIIYPFLLSPVAFGIWLVVR